MIHERSEWDASRRPIHDDYCAPFRYRPPECGRSYRSNSRSNQCQASAFSISTNAPTMDPRTVVAFGVLLGAFVLMLNALA